MPDVRPRGTAHANSPRAILWPSPLLDASAAFRLFGRKYIVVILIPVLALLTAVTITALLERKRWGIGFVVFGFLGMSLSLLSAAVANWLFAFGAGEEGSAWLHWFATVCLVGAAISGALFALLKWITILSVPTTRLVRIAVGALLLMVAVFILAWGVLHGRGRIWFLHA